MKNSLPTYWVAYSGGVDSHVLLHTLVSLRQHYFFELRTVHIHHGLNPKADDWQRHCEKVCQDLNVELTVHKLDLSASHENIEARARDLRYDFFASLLEENDCLLTGHHQDDQAETVLLQLTRGAGPKGLSAMPAKSALGKGFLLRPFLNLTRDELFSYAQEHQLTWIDDDSNENVRFTRNFMRQEIFPVLKKRWPNVTEAITRSARHCAETEKLLEEFIAPLLQCCLLENNALSLSELKKLTLLQQKHVFRQWLFHCGFASPNERKLENCLRVFLTAAQDRHPMVTWANVIVRRYKTELRAEHVCP
ncbi:MAG: tRNA lysidine(34) synthetase TilS [Pseudomonadota bacterium]